MIYPRLAIIAALLAVLLFALPMTSHSEERFGPWAYFAPYYFPPDKCCLGHCFGPEDFGPRYESPNPPIPKSDPPPPPEPRRQRVQKVPQVAGHVPHAQLAPDPIPMPPAPGPAPRAISSRAISDRPISAAQTVSRPGPSGPNKPINGPRAANTTQPRPVGPPAPGSQGHSM